MRVVRPVVRWLLVFTGATFGSWCGRVIAAALYGEPVTPLLRVNARTLLQQDVVPGFLAAELIGRGLDAGPVTEMMIAAAGAAASAIGTGRIVSNEQRATSNEGGHGSARSRAARDSTR
jgi:hypothetical protein